MVLLAEKENLGGSSSAPERCPDDHNCEAPQRAVAAGLKVLPGETAATPHARCREKKSSSLVMIPVKTWIKGVAGLILRSQYLPP